MRLSRHRHGLAKNYPNYGIPCLRWACLTCFIGYELNDWLFKELNKDLKLYMYVINVTVPPPQTV